ncbi:MAG: NAD(P)/FAD-dependent oxidoreductase [Deltaproteobacteria bacterium]|nr:NAD(P)/FAD-dependent oxidoreductase [Deltaproteobacteria bacterium]
MTTTATLAHASVAIIGGGIAGLAAGCYARMNGLAARIYECELAAGGLCTSWRRGEYGFDGCIQWLVGSGPGHAAHQLWRELGALTGRRFHDPDEHIRIQDRSGATLIVYTNADRLEEHLRGLAPEDTRPIGALCHAIRSCARSSDDTFLTAIPNPSASSAGVEQLRVVRTYSDLSVEALASEFQNPFLRRVLPRIFDLPELSSIALVSSLGSMHARSAGFPLGGSLELAKSIEARFIALGGDLRYGARVSRVLVERRRAVGVELSDGTRERADWVVSAADGHSTLFKLIGAPFTPEPYRARFEARPIFPSAVQVSIGANLDLSSTPASLRYELDEPIDILGDRHDWLSIRHYAFDPSMAPPGKSSVAVSFHARLEPWIGCADYDSARKTVGNAVVSALDRRFPGFASHVEQLDVVTPRTFVRRTGNWRGSTEGWLLTPRNVGERMSQTLPGLDGFFMAGHWVEPGGGVPAAAASGRKAIERLCLADRREFLTSEA